MSHTDWDVIIVGLLGWILLAVVVCAVHLYEIAATIHRLPVAPPSAPMEDK